MRIAVDARPLNHPFSGIGRYTKSMLSRMLPDEANEWFLYSDAEVDPELVNIGNVHTRTFSTNYSLLRTIYSQVLYRRWAMEDEVHIFWSPRHHLPMALSGSIRQVVTIHDLVWRVCPGYMKKLNWIVDMILMPRAIKQADSVVCVSEATCRLLLDYKDVNRKTKVITGASEFSSTLQSEGTKPKYFLFVGTLEPRKNISMLIDAFRDISIELSWVELTIVGAKGWGANLGKIPERVRLLENVDDEQLSRLYMGAIALVAPSWYEGFSLPVVEAISHCLPVIGSNDSAIKEAIGSAGLIVDASSVKGLAFAMKMMATSKSLRRHFVLCARKERERYSWDASSIKLLKLFEATKRMSQH